MEGRRGDVTLFPIFQDQIQNLQSPTKHTHREGETFSFSNNVIRWGTRREREKRVDKRYNEQKKQEKKRKKNFLFLSFVNSFLWQQN